MNIIEYLSKQLNKPESSIIQYAKSLEEKGLVKLEISKSSHLKLTEEGKYYLEHGLPEEIMYNKMLKLMNERNVNSIPIKELIEE